jgi:hypothetical protein
MPLAAWLRRSPTTTRSRTIAESIRFHWDDGHSGVRQLNALLGLQPIHRGRDLFREWLKRTGGEPTSAKVRQPTYAPSPAFERRLFGKGVGPACR